MVNLKRHFIAEQEEELEELEPKLNRKVVFPMPAICVKELNETPTIYIDVFYLFFL